jgi:hypothetical protein
MGISHKQYSSNIMTQVTDTDIRDIKTALDANTKAITNLSTRKAYLITAGSAVSIFWNYALKKAGYAGGVIFGRSL